VGGGKKASNDEDHEKNTRGRGGGRRPAGPSWRGWKVEVRKKKGRWGSIKEMGGCIREKVEKLATGRSEQEDALRGGEVKKTLRGA